MLLNLVLIFDFLTLSRLKEKANLSIINFHYLFDRLSRKFVDINFLVIFPNHNIFLFHVDTNKFSFMVEVKVLNFRFIRLNEKHRFCVSLELPSFDSLIRNAVVFSRLSVFDDDLLEQLILIGKGSNFFAAILGANSDLVEMDLAKKIVVNICEEVNIFISTIPLFKSFKRI